MVAARQWRQLYGGASGGGGGGVVAVAAVCWQLGGDDGSAAAEVLWCRIGTVVATATAAWW